ncbi:hypothetical protein [Siphonobacter sp.]|uniref:hypothetical protein n=1 Tax=Siphonobacter sp. TaxID=1869184 RepID=UPI003B3A9BDE
MNLFSAMKKPSLRQSLIVLGGWCSVLSLSCSKPSSVKPEEVIPATFVLQDVRYFKAASKGFDTLAVKLKGITVSNPGDQLMTQPFTDTFDELVKTSAFEVTTPNALPKEVNLSEFSVRVPERWYANDSYGLSTETFPLRTQEEQKPYGSYQKETLNLNIPPKSTIVVDRQIQAYHLTCSFSAVVVNEATGQRYPVSGTWKGISHYNNASVKLTQHPLSK